MTKKRSPLARLIDWVWREPKGKVGAKLKQICEDMPHKQRLMVVTVLLSAFVLIAFFVFGHACYKIGARQALHDFEIKHLYQLDLPENNVPDAPRKKEINPFSEFDNVTDSAYDDTGMESEN